MPLTSAVRPGYVAASQGNDPGMYTPTLSASGSVSASASTQATGALILVLLVVVIAAERWLR